MKTTLQVPIDRNLKKVSEKTAYDFGFSSLQEMVRVFLKQASSGRLVPQFSSSVEFLTKEQEDILTQKYLRAKEEIKKGRGFIARNAGEMVNKLDEE